MRRSPEDEQTVTALSHGTARSARRVAAFRVAIVTGPNKGQSLTIDGTQPSRLLLGKSPACALRLDDPEVSRRHASLDVVDADLCLTDLESTNGTFVNGVRISGASLRGGEVV